MNLVELFDSLDAPVEGEKIFSAIQIPYYPSFRIAVDIEGNPIILLSALNSIGNIRLKNFRLKHLQLEQNVDCKIFESGKAQTGVIDRDRVVARRV